MLQRLAAVALISLLLNPQNVPAGVWPQVPVADESRSADSFVAYGKKAMVASAHPEASKAGLNILKQGGNAFDAAVAVSFAVSVVKPQSTGLGGGGFLLGFASKTKQVKVYDFRERAPLAAKEDMFLDRNGMPKAYINNGLTLDHASINGHLSAGVPGLVAGLIQVHKKHGQLPLEKVVAPAIDLAARGFPVYRDLAAAIVERKTVLASFPATKAIFFRKGEPLKVGELLVQSDLAETLRLIAKSSGKDFYSGSIARKIVAEMKKGGGIISSDDLVTYRVLEPKPVSGQYRGYRIVSMPPPSSGGVHILQMFNMLGTRTFDRSHFHNADSVHFLAEVMRRAYADRSEYLGDPAFFNVPVKGLLAKPYATKLARSIDPKQATLSNQVKPGNPNAVESPSTTHLSVVDGEGNAVSSTQTINYTFGSGVVIPGTGVILNDEMDDFSIKPGVPNAYGLVGSKANAIKAKKTMLSSMSPTLVFSPNGELDMIVGSPGGSKIITAVLQTIRNRIDYGMDLESAVQSPRIHHQWLPDKLFFEAGALQLRVIAQLKQMGHQVEESTRHGDIQAIARVKERSGWLGVSDRRHFGMPLGF